MYKKENLVFIFYFRLGLKDKKLMFILWIFNYNFYKLLILMFFKLFLRIEFDLFDII